jgi:hypothetical protein
MIAGEVTAHKIELISSCRQSYDNLFQYIKSLNADVIFNLRWASRFSPIEGKYNDFAFDNQKGGVELKPNIANYALNSNKNWETSAIAKHNALTNFLNNLASASNRLIIIYPTPEPGWDLPKYNFSRYLQNGSVDRDITIDKNLFDHRQHFVKQVIDGLKTPNMFRIYPSNYMCTSFENTCFIQKDFNAYFYDTNHLSYLGARPIVNEIVEILTDKNSLADRSKSETR